MMLLGLVAFCTVVMRCFPETTIAQWMRTTLVDAPLAWLSKLQRRDVIFLFVIVGLLLVANDFIVLFGMGELLTLGVSLSVYFDAVLVATAVTVAVGVATAWKSTTARLSLWRAKLNHKRRRALGHSRARTPRQPKSRDDDEAPAWALLCAV